MIINQSTKSKTLRLLFAAGGSGGPAAPLLAVAESIKRTVPNGSFLFLGTDSGPEREMVERAGWQFRPVSAGKFRRYFSFSSLLAPFLIVAGFIQALAIIRKFQPACAVGSGSFVQVPVLWAAWFLRLPVLIHQQDFTASLANSLCAPIAKRITVTFERSQHDFHQGLGLYRERLAPKTILTGNPCREEIFDGNRAEAQKFFHLDPDWPTLLVLGGGTGAEAVNKLIAQALPELTRKVQVIHVTGKGKNLGPNHARYHAYEFSAEMGLAYAAADLVISRAGLSTITELSNLEKISIIIPMPDTHQEDNAWLLWQLRAAIIVDQRELTSHRLVEIITKLLFDHSVQQILKHNMRTLMPRNSAEKIAKEILKLSGYSV